MPLLLRPSHLTLLILLVQALIGVLFAIALDPSSTPFLALPVGARIACTLHSGSTVRFPIDAPQAQHPVTRALHSYGASSGTITKCAPGSANIHFTSLTPSSSVTATWSRVVLLDSDGRPRPTTDDSLPDSWLGGFWLPPRPVSIGQTWSYRLRPSRLSSLPVNLRYRLTYIDNQAPALTAHVEVSASSTEPHPPCRIPSYRAAGYIRYDIVHGYVTWSVYQETHLQALSLRSPFSLTPDVRDVLTTINTTYTAALRPP